MKKIFTELLAVIVIFGCLIGLTACGASSKTRPVLGTWWWSDHLGDEYLEFAATNAVTEIYFCSSKFDDSTAAFIEKANQKGMAVYWLAGEYQWVENPTGLIKEVNKYLAYQANYAQQFKGIHLDIEPQQHPEWKSKRSELLQKYVQLTHDLAQTYADLWIEYDIQMSWEEEMNFNGVSKPVFAHVIDNAKRVTIMSYRDTAEKIYKVAEAEVEYAKSVGKSLNLGVETKSSEGNQVSFMEEGKTVMYQEIAKLRQMIPADFGVVIHQIKQWHDLQD